MSAAELPLPADLAYETPPITDDDLDALFGYQATHEGDSDLVLALDAAGEGYADHVVAALPAFRFAVTDLGSAEWTLRKRVAAQAEVDALAEQRDAWMERIGHWFDQASRRPAQTVAWADRLLEAYALAERERDDKVKSIPLPSGVIKTTASPAAAEVTDDAALARYLDAVLLADPGRALDDAELAVRRAWRAAYDAVVEKATTPVTLVQRTPKVYVGPLRKLVTVGEQVIGHRVTVVLSCDHEWSYITNADDPAGEHVVGTFAPCTVCEPDPIDGAQSWPIRHVEVAPETEPAVLGPDGEVVPGVVVKPATVTAKVDAR